MRRQRVPRARAVWGIALVVLLTGCERASTISGIADPDNPRQVAQGEQIYARHCLGCHGANLEGQPNWRRRGENGRLPAPPHDASGHTWHHPDQMLFEITRNGLVPPHAPEGYQSDMPAFNGTLSDEEIWAVLAYIKSRWPPEQRQHQQSVSLRKP